jgi:hypothetical protein
VVTYFTCQRFPGKEINQDHEVCVVEIPVYWNKNTRSKKINYFLKIKKIYFHAFPLEKHF